jgi:hypothetical protein
MLSRRGSRGKLLKLRMVVDRDAAEVVGVEVVEVAAVVEVVEVEKSQGTPGDQIGHGSPHGLMRNQDVRRVASRFLEGNPGERLIPPLAIPVPCQSHRPATHQGYYLPRVSLAQPHVSLSARI